jgi:hypothetical protein
VEGRATFLAAVVLGCFLAAGCGDKKSKEAAAGSGEPAAAAEVKAVVWEGDYECRNGDAECRDDKVGGDGFYFNGTVFNTVINTDATVRAAPTKNGEAIFTAKKDTKVQVLGISKEGWVNVTVRDVVPKRGWIFGQYVDFKDGVNFGGIKTVEMKITDFNFTAKDSSTADLTATCEINGAAKTLKFGAFKEKGQKFFTFFCDAYVEGAHYTVPPGLYVWDFTKNQLKHTVLLTRNPYTFNDAGMLLWKKVRFTDDKKFFFIGDKTEDGAKAAFRASDKKQLFDWDFPKGCDNALSFGFKNNTATFACPADAAMAKNYTGLEEMDGAISDYGSAYVDDNPQPNPASTLEVICDVNLETGARKITGARWASCE